ncbi:DoxX family protein [Streptomyces phaeochromogenes]|uniref:DoxX family protein n=1 Tax=Streptomyces phaeochromogenes TaxID=1923 RepID=UPI0033CE8D50
MTAPRDRRVVIEVDEPFQRERPVDRSMATIHSDVRARVGRISLWILQIALGGLFAFNFGLGKVLGSEQSVELCAGIGVGQWLRILTGALEIAGGIGLLVPLVWLICAAIIAWFRRGHTLALIRQLGALRSPTGS